MVLLSIVLIAIAHVVFNWLSEIFAPPKIVDLIDEPAARYKQIESQINAPSERESMKEILQMHLAKYT